MTKINAEAEEMETPVESEASIEDSAEIVEADDSWSYETPRPWLSIEDAAMMLGRSARGVERSIIGRWGNKLPEGWQARRVRIDGVDEWRIIPPPGFRVKHAKKIDAVTREELNYLQEEYAKEAQREALEHSFTSGESEYLHEEEEKNVATETAEAQSGFSFEKLFQSASQLAQKELASLGLNVKNQLLTESQNHAASLDVEHTIVIDRSDEVEKLLRELANVQKELAEERRQHLEDVRLMAQMQNNMRLLEVNATQTSELKEDLKMAQTLLLEHKKQYREYLALPWWKKIFKHQP